MTDTAESTTALLSALRFAAQKHRDQRRKDREASPYINHPIQVAEVLARVGKVTDPITLISAILHDTIEDTETTPTEIAEHFGETVMQVVQEVTDDKSLPKVERKQLQITGARKKSKHAKQVKLADKICNVSDINQAPPRNWSLKRRREYLDWTEQVVDGLRGVNALLESHYDTVLAEARQKLAHSQEISLEFIPGDRIRYPARQHWGLGEILACEGNKLRIFFVGCGARTLNRDDAALIKLDPQLAHHPILDNLKRSITEHSEHVKDYKSLPEFIELFLQHLPDGFYSDDYLHHCREPLVKAHLHMHAMLNQNVFTQLLEAADYPEISRRVMEVVHKTRLLTDNERLQLRECLRTPASQKLFTQHLHTLLYGHESFEVRFNQFVHCLETLNIAHWAISTYFLFMTYPQTDMFLKPDMTLKVTDWCAFDIAYEARPNWRTYRRLMSFCNYLQYDLSDMRPRDMFDLYGFMMLILVQKPKV